MLDAATVYTIGHAARLTGVPSATLRAWERRYGLVTPVRTEGGYRLYDDRGLQLLRAMGALVAAGWSPRHAAEHLRSANDSPGDEQQRPWEAYLTVLDEPGVGGAEGSKAPDETSDAAARSASSGAGPLSGAEAPMTRGAWDVTALARGAAEMDPVAVGQAVDRAFAAGSLEQVVDSWLMPALRMLGDQWK